MNIVVRLLVGAGIFVLGYYLGREVTRAEFVRDELQEGSENPPDKLDH